MVSSRCKGSGGAARFHLLPRAHRLDQV